MSFAVKVLVGVNEYDINDGTIYRVEQHSGLDKPPVRTISERAPQQHGESYIDYRLDPRIFQLVLGIHATSHSQLETRKGTLSDTYLASANNPLKVKFTTEGGNVRQIECECIGCDMPSMDQTSYCYQKAGLTFKAENPLFYNPTGSTHNFGLGGLAADAMQVPLEIPWNVGQSVLNSNLVVTYAGSFLALPIIRITGPITSAKIVNNTTSETLFFDGITIAHNDYYVIDCRFGYKTIKDLALTNKIADLDESTSDLATFHIAPGPKEAPGGDNSLTVTGTSVTGDTSVTIQYNEQFETLWG